jgi:hypothetical protein
MPSSFWIRSIGLLFSSTMAFSQAAAGDLHTNDLKMTIRYTTGAHSFTTTEYYSGESSRSDMQFTSGEIKGHHRAVIRRKGTDSIQVYDVDLDSHEFVSYRTDMNGSAQGVKPIAIKPSGKTFVINIDTVDTGERQEIFGQVARHLVTREKRIGGPDHCYTGNSESEMDGWYIDFDALPSWRVPRKGSFAMVAASVRRPGEDRCSDKIEVHRSGPNPGFPLKLKTTTTIELSGPDGAAKTYTNVSEMEIIEFSHAPLSAELFQVPADFIKVDKIIDPTQQPLRLQAMTYWQRFKEGIHNLFH